MTDINMTEMIPFQFTNNGKQVAIGCMDGSWYIDWDQVASFAAKEISRDTFSDSWAIMFARLLTEARGGLQEVTRERAEEISKVAGAYINSLAEQMSLKALEMTKAAEEDPRAEYLQFVAERKRKS